MSGWGKWASPEDLVGNIFEGRYQLVRLLGMGGMGAVFEGRHMRLDKRVAIKVLSPALAADDTQRRRFLREARAANRINHDNVVEILDFGEAPVTYFVMEFLQGIDLHDLIAKEGPLPWSRARSIFLQILAALDAAHREGIVHRDMKPSNCFLQTRRDGRDLVKVLDFGIAKVAESSPETFGLTRSNEVMGTVAYMSPEQALANPVDPRTDVYAAGIVLFEMLTGTVPFHGTNAYQVLDKHVRAPPPAPRSINAAVPEAVEFVILEALAKAPAARYQSMAQFMAAVESIDSTGCSGSTQPLAGAPIRESTPPPTTQLLGPAPAPFVAPPPAAQERTARPATSPLRHATTDPSDMFSDERRRKPATMIALVAGGLAIAVGSAYGLGWWLMRDRNDEPVVASVVEAKRGPPPVDAPNVELEPDRGLVIAPEVPAPEPVPIDDAPSDAQEVPPTPALDSDPPRSPNSKPKGKANRVPARETVDSVISRIRRKASSQCRSDLVGTEVTVTFLIRPDGGTALVKAVDPNQRSPAGSCVADLVKAAKFPQGNDGRRVLTVRY